MQLSRSFSQRILSTKKITVFFWLLLLFLIMRARVRKSAFLGRVVTKDNFPLLVPNSQCYRVQRLGGVRDLGLTNFLSKFTCQCQWSLLLVCKHSQIQHSRSKIKLNDHQSERLYDGRTSESARGIGPGLSSSSTKRPNQELGTTLTREWDTIARIQYSKGTE